jgi:hypothetical protein
MGNIMGKKDDLMLDFGGLKTENMSSTIPYMNKLNANAKSLVERLNVTQAPAKIFTESNNYDMFKLFEKTQNLEPTNDNNFSDTSPFISSDIYNNMVKDQKGGMMADNFEDSSSSSSSSTLESPVLEKALEKKEKHTKKHSKEPSPKESSSEETEEDMDMSGGYISSSAHTEGLADSASSVNLSVNNKSNYHKSNNKSNYTYSDSINTTDINMISVDE